MPKIVPTPSPRYDKLSNDEQIDFVRSAATSEQVLMPEWHRQIIRARLAAYNANANAGRLWTAVQTSSGSCEPVV